MHMLIQGLNSVLEQDDLRGEEEEGFSLLVWHVAVHTSL